MERVKTTHSAGRTIFLAGFVAGTLDLLTALTVYAWILKKATAIQILQGIASGIFGRDAFTGGWPMAVCGIVFHYFIAFGFTIAYFLVFPYVPFLRRQKIVSGILYGLFAWIFMNLLVLPLSNAHTSKFSWSAALTGAVILMLMIGIPISLIIHKHYTEKNRG